MAKTLSAVQSFQRVRKSAEKIKCGDLQRFPEAASPGDYFRQGDIYVTLLAGVPQGATKIKREAQLAPGTSRGSRHILDSLVGVTMYRESRASVLTGTIIALKKERTVTHPEHGDVVLPPGVYAITYQRAFADELRRVAD